MKKKLSVFCILALILSMLPSAFAVDASSDYDVSFTSEVENFLSEAVLPFEQEYDISTCEDIVLGSELPGYCLKEDGSLERSTIHFFPVMSNSMVKGLLQVYNNESGTKKFCYSEGYAKCINDLLLTSTGLAVVVEGVSLHFVSDSEAASSPNNDTLELTSPFCNPLNLTCSLNNQMRAPNSASVVVPQRQQPGKGYCWAACVSSFGEYYTSTNISPANVVINSGVGSFATSPEVVQVFSEFYSLRVNYATVRSSTSMTTTITSKISSGNPLLGCFKVNGNSTDGHMVVIRGYASNSSSFNILLMDPTTGSYTTCSVDGTAVYKDDDIEFNTLSIVLGGNELYLVQYLQKA